MRFIFYKIITGGVIVVNKISGVFFRTSREFNFSLSGTNFGTVTCNKFEKTEITALRQK